MGRPSTSLRGSSDSEPELEPLPSSPLSLGTARAPIIGGSPSPARVPPRFLTNLRKEEAIISKQGREKEEKEKDKEEKKLEFAYSKYAL
jgi:hypothetical protein